MPIDFPIWDGSRKLCPDSMASDGFSFHADIHSKSPAMRKSVRNQVKRECT
jgi:hypothetical protein